MPECPTCSDVLETEHGLKIHHSKIHDESISGVRVECGWCGEETTKRPSQVGNNNFCSLSCFREWDSKWKGEEWQGENHPQWKEETVCECEWCENDFKTDSHALKMGRGRFCSQDCHHEWRKEEWECANGENHPNWKGGANDYGENWTRIRKKVHERDKKCLKCGEEGSNTYLDVHHIIPIREFDEPEEANTMSNLVLLCRPCHMKVEHGNTEVPKTEVC